MGFIDKLFNRKSEKTATGTTGMGTTAATTAKDPVCGMTVDPSTAAPTSTHGGATYRFCSITCKERFDQNPQQFTATTPAR